jgi:putative endonuclease
MRVKDALGRYGERVAADHLRRAGMRIVQTNWRCRAGEIDIIAVDGPVLVFCEVKTRSSDAYGGPAAAVTWAKQRRLRELAVRYLSENPGSWRGIRFDVVAILRPRSGATSIEHLRDVIS